MPQRCDTFSPRWRRWTTLFQCGEFEEAADRLKPLLASHRIELDSESPEFRELASEGMRCAIAAFARAEETLEAGRLDDEALARLQERHGPTTVPQQVIPEATQRQGGSDVPAAHYGQRRSPSPDWSLHEIYERYIDAKRGLSWKAEAEDDAELALYLFEELVGLHKIGQITHEHASDFREYLRQLPKYHGKGHFAGKKPRTAIDEAGAQDAALKDGLNAALAAGEISRDEYDQRLEEGRVPRCGPKTINKHLDYLGGSIKWANKRYGWELKNPFAGSRFSKRELLRGGRPRRAMKNEELKGLFETPLFTGCSSENRRSLPGKLVLKDSFYWVPLVITFTGARLEEVCQLTTADVLEVEGTWCISISDQEEDQETKTEAARRLIPLHGTLLKLGFIERVLELRETGQRRVFPDLTAGGRYGRYGYRLTKRWTHYRRQAGVYEPGKDFHTLRHSFNTHLLNKKIPIVWMSQLMGHATPGQTAGHAVNLETASTYYGGAEIPQLKEAVEQFDFGLRLVDVGGEWQITR